MKMTDADSAKDLCRRFDELVNAPSGGSQEEWSEWQCDAAAELLHVAARLAADQQKGGGCNCEVSAGLAAFHKDDCRAMAPQPSIPAPAQQEVGDVEAVEFRAAFFVSKDGNRVEQLTSYEDYRSDGALLRLMDLGQKRASAKKLTKKGGGKVVLSWIGAALAHPPHADQETQG